MIITMMITITIAMITKTSSIMTITTVKMASKQKNVNNDSSNNDHDNIFRNFPLGALTQEDGGADPWKDHKPVLGNLALGLGIAG